jgi:hypothetical protein
LQTTPEPPYLWEHIIDEIAVLSGIAKANGSLVSLKDLATLTRTNLSEEQIQSSWETIPELASSYELKDGLIIQRGNDNNGNGRDRFDLELEKRVRSESYARYAREFASLCHGRDTNLIAISGSTSYKTPSKSDDLDIFCITKPDHLWLFMTKSLLLARILHVFRRDFPRICFSYAVDQDFAEEEFLFSRDALFARDALTTIVVHGQDYYTQLLKKSPWISNYFPRLYQNRTSITCPEGVMAKQDAYAPSRKFLNLLLLVITGNYIRFKSSILNRNLSRKSHPYSLFTAKIGRDHCVFESVRYVNLKSMYRKLIATNLGASTKETEHH